MRFGLMVLLTGLLGCADQPTMAGGTADRPAGQLFFVRSAMIAEVGTGARLHVTTNASLRDAVPTASPPGALGASVRATPDGRFLAWWVDFTIITMDRFSGATTVITPPGGYQDRLFAWFPGGNHLVVHRTRPDGVVQYVRVARDGSQIRTLPIDSTFSNINGLDLSPDGTELLLSRGNYTVPPYIVQVSDGAKRPIEFPRPNRETLSAVRWSPDGSRFVAFERSFGAPDRWVVRDREGRLLATRERTVVGSVPRDYPASWSPDGSQIAVCEWVEQLGQSSYPRGRNGIVLWTVGTGAEDILTPAGVEDCRPEWTK